MKRPKTGGSGMVCPENYMSLNRYRMNGKMKIVIRRTTDGKPWLSKVTRPEFAYCLACSMAPTGVVVHAALLLADMCILVVTDTAGLLSFGTQRLHTCLTELVNNAHGRPRGTIWDNRRPAESFVVGWRPALQVIGLLAMCAAAAAGSNDPYDCRGYFGPRDWGTCEKVMRPNGFGKRSTRPQQVWFTPKSPHCAPRDLFLDELVEIADAHVSTWVAASCNDIPPRLAPPQPCKPMSLERRLPEIIGEPEVVELLTEELRLWRAYYRRCRDEFKLDQLTVFPAGTDRFRALGAAVDPCPTYIAPPAPRRLHPRGSPA